LIIGRAVSLFACAVLPGLALFDAPLLAQDSPTERSNREARRTVEYAVTALGGSDAIKMAETLGYTLRGSSWQLFANRDPEEPPEPWEYERTCALDPARNRFFGEVILRRPGTAYVSWTRSVVDGGEGWEAIMPNRWFFRLEAPSASDFRECARFLPHTLLAEALRQAAGLRSLGRVEVDGHREDLVTYVTPGGRQTTLAFDSDTHLPTRYEYLYTRSMTGDARFTAEFHDYQPVGGTQVPMRRITQNAGLVSSDARFVEIGFEEDPLAGRALEVPQGFVAIDAMTPELEVAHLAPDVYLARNLPGGYNALFVAFPDYVLVVEAPESDDRSGISEQLFHRVRETVPDKPIRYLVLTHHHGDHASGARTFVAEGNVGLLQRLVASPFTLAPDPLAKNPRPLRVELVDGERRVFEGAGRRVELYDVGPIPHAEEMLVAYLPAERILFQSDLFNPVTPQDREPIAYDDPWHGVDIEDTRALLAFIRTERLEVERIVGSHGRIGTMEELIEAARTGTD
jgi:glyoxylase-like metal-dependent hydrolase (beta-lactamase superfamily II)